MLGILGITLTAPILILITGLTSTIFVDFNKSFLKASSLDFNRAWGIGIPEGLKVGSVISVSVVH